MFKIIDKFIFINYLVIFTIIWKNFIKIEDDSILNIVFDIFNFNNLGLFLIITTCVTFLICYFIIDNKYFYKNKKLTLLFFSFLVTIIFISIANNLIVFFILYEMLLIPSYFILKNSSPSRRINTISNYFLFWTQFGSFLVLLGIIFLIKLNDIFYFEQIHSAEELNYFSKILIFFGFSVKIPLWPFHFWLSKTHVEANTSFSIFLSGILVKSAVYGFFKFSYLFSNEIKSFTFIIILVSIVDASIKIVNQVDLKKLVAFSTIQEMGFLILFLHFFIHFNYAYVILFLIFHTLISGYYFFFVDSIYKIFQSRVNYNISGLSNINYKLSTINIIFLFIFIGIPFTVKFFIEFFILKMLFKNNIMVLYIIVWVSQYMSVVFYFRNFISINYGSIKKIKNNEISKKEFIVYLFFFISLIAISIL